MEPEAAHKVDLSCLTRDQREEIGVCFQELEVCTSAYETPPPPPSTDASTTVIAALIGFVAGGILTAWQLHH